jgi:hypothetical protein
MDEWMHSGDAKITDLVREHLQIKEKTKMSKGYEQRVKNERERMREHQICFLRVKSRANFDSN